MMAIPYVLAGITVLAGTIAAYVGFGGAIPHTLREWATFGIYLGGVTGPLLSFLALTAVARMMHLQREALELDRSQRTADQHLRLLDALYEDVAEAFDARLSPQFALRAVVGGDTDPSGIDPIRLADCLDNLMRLLAQYCQAIVLYRENISEFYDLRIHADRGSRLLDAIKPFQSYMSGRFRPMIELCGVHLGGGIETAVEA